MNPKKLARKVAPKKAIRLAEESYRKGRVGLAHIKTGVPGRGMKIIAVTGTNGKTSTCNFINDALKNLGYRTALFTTAVIELDGDRSINTNHTTVPKTGELFAFLKSAKTKGVDYVILEVTSHALHQHKIWGLPIEIAVMTNLSQDHLDYHGTMQAYAKAKARLFGGYMHPKYSVLNRDDEWFEFYNSRAEGIIATYGRSKDTTLRIVTSTSSTDGLTLRLETRDGSILSTPPVIGDFNAYNLAAVATVLNIIGVQPDKIRKSLDSVSSVPGRMEMVRASNGITAIVDYAHAPDALEKALQALKATTKRGVVVVFGATGDRDKSKRPIMGQIASDNADRIYLTDDETYTEDGDAIRKSVMEGIVEAGGRSKTAEIADRREAIKQALKEAKKGDMILIAGLGHQNYRAMGNDHMPWQETEVVRELMAELGIA